MGFLKKPSFSWIFLLEVVHDCLLGIYPITHVRQRTKSLWVEVSWNLAELLLACFFGLCSAFAVDLQSIAKVYLLGFWSLWSIMDMLSLRGGHYLPSSKAICLKACLAPSSNWKKGPSMCVKTREMVSIGFDTEFDPWSWVTYFSFLCFSSLKS